ncbi:hypothetical protein HDU67_006178 [Dinochytrium kinnereticum]|nr:hypothetical protein HDU67_006178 [Dinochytrium kinnereticum]
MAHPSVWTPEPFFYAFGNVPPVNLLQDLAPEDPARVLQLGCGDPRNILFSVWSVVGGGMKGGDARLDLDVTCNDYDPGVLSRNILLLSLLSNPPSTPQTTRQIWSLFYHIYIDPPTHTLLLTHLTTLLDAAETLEKWNQSPHGAFLRFCSRKTFEQVKGLWVKYRSSSGWSGERLREIRERFGKEVEGERRRDVNVVNIFRSCGPMFKEGAHLVHEGYERFWEKGVAFWDSETAEASTIPNPTMYFCFRGDRFNLHYGSDPIFGYHIAALLIPCKGLDHLADTSAKGTEKFSRVAEFAFSQFEEWGKAWRIARGGVKVRFMCSESLAFCRALDDFAMTGERETGHYVGSFSFDAIELDGNLDEVPVTTFNVIDTSNLTDHSGLINVLAVAAPLLSHSPDSVLYTETLVNDGTTDPIDQFRRRMMGDVSAMSLIMGVTPVAYVSGFASHSTSHELITQVLQMGRKGYAAQYHDRIAWKRCWLADGAAVGLGYGDVGDRPMGIDARQLATYLYNTFLAMFADDGVADAETMRLLLKDPTVIRRVSLVHYVRKSFVQLLKLVRRRFMADWLHIIDDLTSMIEMNKTLILGMNYYQDMCAHLFMTDLYSADLLRPSDNRLSPIKVTDHILRHWPTPLPFLVCITLIVPRKHLTVLNDPAARRGVHIIQCELHSQLGLNYFSDIQAVFGEVRVEGRDDQTSVIVSLDPLEFSGRTSKLVVSFWVPAWILTLAREAEMGCSLNVRQTLNSQMALAKTLGPYMRLFDTTFADKRSVIISRERPGCRGQIGKIMRASKAFVTSPSIPLKQATSITSFVKKVETPREVTVNPVSVVLDSEARKVVFLGVKIEFGGDVRGWLAAGGVVRVRQVGTPCCVEVLLEGWREGVVMVAFPYPVDGGCAKLRIARKSGYVEVLVPVAGHKLAGGFPAHSRFPLVLLKTAGSNPRVFPSPWNIHRVNLDRLPLLQIWGTSPDQAKTGIRPLLRSAREKLSHVSAHLNMAFTERERAMKSLDFDDYSGTDVFVDVKESIAHLFARYLGIGDDGLQTSLFALDNPDENGVYAILFVSGVRLDVAAGTFVLDACVLPLTVPLIMKHQTAIAALHQSGSMMRVVTRGEEVKAWKELFPVFVERCRTWSHLDRCEYKEKRKIPLSYQTGVSPICSCSHGRSTDAMGKVALWKPFEKVASRAAVSLMFSPSFLEFSNGGLAKLVEKSMAGLGGRSSTLSMQDRVAAASALASRVVDGGRDGGGERKKTGDGGEKPVAGCFACGKVGEVMRCGRCKSVSYCSQTCQRNDWKIHKAICK